MIESALGIGLLWKGLSMVINGGETKLSTEEIERDIQVVQGAILGFVKNNRELRSQSPQTTHTIQLIADNNNAIIKAQKKLAELEALRDS